jgi:hypothetical protein
MHASTIRLFAMALLAIALSCVQTTATLAGTTATIHGTVTDDAGHTVAGVAVSAISPSFSNHTVSGSNGFYALAGLPSDTYAVTFSKQGYQTVQVPGITLSQDQNYALSIKLAAQVKTIGRVAVRGSISLFQPTTTADTYTVNPAMIQQITGTPQNISETAVLDALPGITTDNAGYPVIRGGAENEEGYQLEGVDATEPFSGQFINSLSLAGTARLQLSTGGYDVSEGNTNAGVINEVIKRGTYPGNGQATLSLNDPNFDHRLAFEYGSATADNRFSYFFAFNGLRQYRVYGDPTAFYPELFGAVGDASGNIDTFNMFYRWGANNANEIQVFGETGSSYFAENYGIDPSLTPYATNNNIVLATLSPVLPFIPLAALEPLFPGQAGLSQNTNYADNETNSHTIEKVTYKRQFSPSSFGDVTVYRTMVGDDFNVPWNGGAFNDNFQYTTNSNYGFSADYNAQLSSRHQLGVGAETVYSSGSFALGAPSIAPFIFGNEFAYVGTPAMPIFPVPAGVANDPIHRQDAWIKDYWTPNNRLTLTYGLRWDQEVLSLPADASQNNFSFTTDGLGDVVEVPGPAITSDVTHPSQLSPRIALSYELSPRDAVRFSYGKNIEFTPLSNIEAKAVDVNPALANCNIANGCFTPLPGFGTTNNITNLYQSTIGDYNTNFFAQYTPVLPQRATSVDASWEHDFGRGYELRLTPYYRKGVDYVVANTPLLFTLADGTPVFGSPREQNAGINQSTGIEFQLQRLATYGMSGFLTVTYDNTLANYDSDFFPVTNDAALALNHFFHVSYVAPITATLQLNYSDQRGLHVYANMPYESGYPYGVGTHTFVYEQINGVNTPVEVLNTDLTQAAPQQSAYYFTDPTNPGTILNPNITGSRGTNEGPDPGSLHSPQILALNLTLAHDIGRSPRNMQAGITVGNVFGNYSGPVTQPNPRYQNNGIGGYGATSGESGGFGLEPYHQAYAPQAYLAPPIGTPRTYVFYFTAKY